MNGTVAMAGGDNQSIHKDMERVYQFEAENNQVFLLFNADDVPGGKVPTFKFTVSLFSDLDDKDVSEV